MSESDPQFRVVCPECGTAVVRDSYEAADDWFMDHAEDGCLVELHRMEMG
jgi:uncharacterized protein YaiI (UPF0178 family)